MRLEHQWAISAAKAGVEGLARAAASDYAKRGIRVNVISPGLVDTPLSSHLLASEQSRKISEDMHPVGKIGEPDDIACMNGQEFTGCYNTVSHSLTDTTQAICESYMWTPPVDIATTAMSTGIHTSLVAALSASELVATLQGDGPFTVFAPTDQAFADAGIDLAAFTTDEDIATLTDILLYHVYSGAVNAADVTDGLTVAMVNGDDASFTVTDGTVMVGDATVVLADVPASNGVIHVIDKVLMPPAPYTGVGICYNSATHMIAAGASMATHYIS